MALTLFKKLAKGFGKGSDTGARWAAPVALDHGHIGEACFAMDRHGRGQALWENAGSLWTQALGPGMDQAFGRHPLGEGKAPRIAVNLEGRGVATWILEAPTDRQIIGLPFDPASRTRASSRALFRTFGTIRDVQVAVDRRGSAMVVWSHELDGEWETLAKSFDVRSKAWDQEPVRLGPRVKHPVEPRLAMNRRGQATVLWEEQTDRADGLVAATYVPSQKLWSDRPVSIATGRARDYRVAMDHSGNVMALWVKQDYGRRPSLESRMYSAIRSDWCTPETLATAQSFRQLRLAMTGTGEALALWLQSEGSAQAFLHSKAFRGGAWEEHVTRLDSESGRVESFDMALGARGQAGLLCILRDHEGRVPVVRERGKSWEATLPVGPRSDRSQTQPVLYLCPHGSVALWQQGSGGEALLAMAMRS